jgi:CRISPR/Cas system-associated exonuclease Cas4 (RecB family)
MSPATFTVSEVRVAATCPRISYFDAEATRRKGLKTRAMTRLWKAGDAETACGSLFHNAIEAFNRRALEAAEVRAAVEEAADPRAIEQRLRAYLNVNCVNLDTLATKPASQQQAFIRAVEVYMGELADIIGDARSRGKPAGEVIDHLFGDRRRRVDVTFQVGARGEPVRVTGTLDYVFYDWRTAHHRVIDYKLTPAGEPSNDLFQVALYALMHTVQHRTTPDVGVLYLHPERRMVELSWDEVHGQRHKLFDLLASLAEWVRYDERGGAGLKPPGEPSWCPHCKWDKQGQCFARLGPKHEGVRLHHWTDAAGGTAADASAEPTVGIREPSGPSGAWASEVETEPEEEITVSTGDSLRIGATVSGGMPVDLPLSALPTHVAVVGAAGSGKTWMAKVIVEEAIRLGVPVLAIDPQGDLVQFLRPAAEPPGLSHAERAMRRDVLDRVEPRIWTPGSSHGRRLCLDPIHLAGRDELARIADPDRREEEWQGMLGVAAAQLMGLAKVGGETDSQQTFLLQVFRRLASGRSGRDATLESIAAAAADPQSIGLEEPDQLIKKAERTKLARKLHAMRLGPASVMFTGGTRLDLDALRRPDETGKTPLNVFYLNALADDDWKHFFAAALAAEVYRWMITSLDAAPGRPSLLFYLDEARDYIPAGTARPPAKGPLIRLFTQGRKYGVACLLCTQSPRSVDYNVFGNCSTKLIGRLESQQDLERVAQWFSTEGAVPPWISARKGAPAGSFVGRWPQMPAELDGRAFRSRPLFSLHEGAWSPDRLEREMKEGMVR